MTAIYKLKQKDQFTYQIKSGRKVVDKITKVSGGWYVCCKVFDTVEQAVVYWVNSQQEMLEAFGGTSKVVVEKV